MHSQQAASKLEDETVMIRSDSRVVSQAEANKLKRRASVSWAGTRHASVRLSVYSPLRILASQVGQLAPVQVGLSVDLTESMRMSFIQGAVKAPRNGVDFAKLATLGCTSLQFL